jgi:hypothetical protein
MVSHLSVLCVHKWMTVLSHFFPVGQEWNGTNTATQVQRSSLKFHITENNDPDSMLWFPAIPQVHNSATAPICK